MSREASGKQIEGRSPDVIAFDDSDESSDSGSEWKPYVGPEGGTGWTNGEDVVYNDEPPGRLAGLDDNQYFQSKPDDFDSIGELTDWVEANGLDGEDLLLNVDGDMHRAYLDGIDRDLNPERPIIISSKTGEMNPKKGFMSLEMANEAIIGQTRRDRDEWGKLVGAESYDPPETEQHIPDDLTVDLTTPFWQERHQEQFDNLQHPMWMSKDSARNIHERAVDQLSEYYDDDTVNEFEGQLERWQKRGYDTVPEMWIAAMSVLDTDKTPTPLLEDGGDLKQEKIDEADQDVVEIFADMIRLSQNTAEDYFEGDEVEVYRQFSQSVIRKYAQETEDGFKVNPQVLESWSVKETKADSHAGDGGLVVEKGVDPQDVGIFGPIGLGPVNTKYAEVTLMREEPYEFADEDIINDVEMGDISITKDDGDIPMLPLEETLFTDENLDTGNNESPQKAKWLPFKGPQMNGWTDGESVTYSLTPPGAIDVDSLSDDEATEMRKAFEKLPESVVSSGEVERMFETQLACKTNGYDKLIERYRSKQIGGHGVGEVLVDRALHAILKAGEWVPYEGPEGGSGWRNTSTGEIDYSDQPPGELDSEILSDEQMDQIRDYIGSESASEDIPVDVDVGDMENVDQQDVSIVVDSLDDVGLNRDSVVNFNDYVVTLLEYMNQHYPRITSSTVRNLVTRLSDMMVYADPDVLATSLDMATAMFLSQQQDELITGLFKDESEGESGAEEGGDESEWVPYEGPQGGVGWLEVGEGNVTYQDEPPGTIDGDKLTDRQIEQIREEFEVDFSEEEQTDSDSDESSDEQIADPDWAEEELGDEYGVDIDSVESGDLVVIGGRKEMIGEVSGGEIVTDPPNSWDKPDTYTEFDGRLARSRNAGFVRKDAEQYLEFPDRVDVPDGWYTSGEGGRDDEGNQIIDIQNEEGEVFGIELSDPELAYDPFKFDKIEADHDSPWEEYDSDMSEDAGIEDIPIDLEDFGHEQLSDEQSGMVMNGLSKADDIGLIDDLDKLMGSDKMNAVAQYNPGMKVMTFNPDRFTQEEIDEKRDNYYVAERPEEVALHESMHCKHAQVLVEEKGWSMEEIKNKLLDSRLDAVEREVIEEDVSEYGCANPLEIVAEIGTMIVKGEEVSDRAMALYQEYGGPEL